VNRLISISGPTAVGKTKLSIDLAKKINCEIISFDSRQFYKEMSIGTAVPKRNELDQVKHHFIQHKSIHDSYNINQFSNDAKKLINELFKKNKYIILVGGSFLYLKSIIYGINNIPDIPNELRHELSSEFHKKGIDYLKKLLKELDPKYYDIVDLNNHRRLIRAIEVCKYTNKTFSSYLRGFREKKYNHTSICLTLKREELYSNINKRVNDMVNMGLIEEAKNLYKFKNLNPLNTIGYKELFNHFDGLFKIDKAIDEIKKNSRRFAKKQFTWLNNNDEHVWVDSGIGVSENVKKLEKIVF
tara:strand:- start:84 stop:983 length:900 start_codon:yes stop_codon:yes gene_type:complete